MKIVRYQDASGSIHFGNRHADGHTTRIDGDILGVYADTGTSVTPHTLLAPNRATRHYLYWSQLQKTCRRGNKPVPEHPVVFMKNSGTLQHPGGPIVLPRRLRSDSVDYECELAVVLKTACHNVSRADALNHVLGYTCAQ